MKLYLGVDGGGTGCRAAICDADGVILGRGAGGPANIMSDFEGSRDNIIAAAEAALRDGGIPAKPGVLCAVLGLAGANIAKASERLAGALPFASARIESDALIAMRGALGTADGITATIGTGSIFAEQRAGLFRGIGGWGFRLSDHGSGARMGQAILEAALLAHDGLAPRSPLLDALVVEAGGPQGLVTFAHNAVPADFATLAPRIFAAAGMGDGAAQAVVHRAEADITAAIDLLSADGPVPICFLGSVGKIFEERLAGRYGDLMRAPLGSALDGALAMARGGGVMGAAFAPVDAAGTRVEGDGPLYLRLSRRIAEEIDRGALAPGEGLPPEREMAALTGLSRVTVRKAVQALVETGRLVQRRGSGTFVAPRVERLEQALSLLTSFSEDMARRGRVARSIWLSRAVHAPTPDEMMVLGLGARERVARLERVRLADDVPMAIERAALSSAILPEPERVDASLYAVLRRDGLRPVRAVQRISATNLGLADAELLGVPVGAAGLRIERVSYLASGRVVEFTKSIYRGDAYDFAAELQIPAEAGGDE